MFLTSEQVEQLNFLSKKDAVEYIKDLKSQLDSNDLLTDEIAEELDQVLINHHHVDENTNEDVEKIKYAQLKLLSFKQTECEKIFKNLDRYRSEISDNYKHYGDPKTQIIISREQRNAIADIKAKYPEYIIQLAESVTNPEQHVIGVYDRYCAEIKECIDFNCTLQDLKSQVTFAISQFHFEEEFS